MVSPIHGYAEGLPDEMTLGYVVFYTISDPQITHVKLLELVQNHGLDAVVVPQPPRSGDAFKRACRYSERQGLPIPSSDHTANFLIRSVAQTTDEIERHIVVEIRDTQNRMLSYSDCVHLKFDRKNNKLEVNRLDMGSGLNPLVEQTVEMFYENLKLAANYIDAQQLRRMVREQLDIMHAISIRRNGSVYFVPQRQKAKVEGLEGLLRDMGNGSVFHSLPLVNTSKQRDFIRLAFEEEVHDIARQKISELSQKRDEGKKLSAKSWEDYRNALNTLKQAQKDYQELVTGELTKAEIELGAYETHLMDFLLEGKVQTSNDSK